LGREFFNFASEKHIIIAQKLRVCMRAPSARGAAAVAVIKGMRTDRTTRHGLALAAQAAQAKTATDQ
jgi:hypothetical protein